MNREILTLVDVVSNERGVDKSVIFQAVEAALASATLRRNREEIEVRVAIDRNTGDYSTYRRWLVMSDDAELTELDPPNARMSLSDAIKKYPDTSAGEYVEESMSSVKFGRIEAQTAKQVIVQKVREAERARELNVYGGQVGRVLRGVVKRAERHGVILDLGDNVDGIIPRDHVIPRESIRPGDRVRACLSNVESVTYGPQLFFSRTSNQFLVELFKIEVPEISEGIIDIKSVARDPGARAKIAVTTKDPRVDPIGACVGMRGSRVQAVCNDLAGERIDIILWDEDPAQFAVNALAPAEAISITVDEETRAMDIIVTEEQLALAIGRGGQNIRLASGLTGWKLNLMSASEATVKNTEETQKLIALFMRQLDVDEEVANILVQERFSGIEEIAYIPESEMQRIEEFDEELIKALRARARDTLITSALLKEEKLDQAAPSQELLDLKGMDSTLAGELALTGVKSVQDLADCSVDEICQIEGMGEERAALLIMAARAPLFDKENKEEEKQQVTSHD